MVFKMWGFLNVKTKEITASTVMLPIIITDSSYANPQRLAKLIE